MRFRDDFILPQSIPPLVEGDMEPHILAGRELLLDERMIRKARVRAEQKKTARDEIEAAKRALEHLRNVA